MTLPIQNFMGDGTFSVLRQLCPSSELLVVEGDAIPSFVQFTKVPVMRMKNFGAHLSVSSNTYLGEPLKCFPTEVFRVKGGLTC